MWAEEQHPHRPWLGRSEKEMKMWSVWYYENVNWRGATFLGHFPSETAAREYALFVRRGQGGVVSILQPDGRVLLTFE